MSKGPDCFIGVDVWAGSVRMFVPGLFASEMYNDLNGEKAVRAYVDSKVIDEMTRSVIQNNVAYRSAAIMGEIYPGRISKKVAKKINRYLLRGNQTKAENKVLGYSRAVLGSFLEGSNQILEETNNHYMNSFEEKEMEPFELYGYRAGGSYVLNIPDNLFAIFNPKEGLKVNMDPEFIRGEAKKNIQTYKNNPEVTTFALPRKVIGELERACFDEDIGRRDDLIKGIMGELISLIDFIESDEGDSSDGD